MNSLYAHIPCPARFVAVPESSVSVPIKSDVPVVKEVAGVNVNEGGSGHVLLPCPVIQSISAVDKYA